MRAVVALVTVAVWLLSRTALAEDCARANVLHTIPSDGATGVPINAELAAHYASTAEYLDEEVTLEEVGGDTQSLVGEFLENESLLVIRVESLRPDTDYQIDWPRLRGIGSAPTGSGREVSFRTGSAADEAPPQFDGIEEVTWDIVHDKDPCTDRSEERYEFDIELGRVTDDGGTDSLTLIVFQTKGPDIDDPKQVHLQSFPDDSKLRITQSIEGAVGDVCFAAVARDSTAKTSSSGNREQCVHTVRPPVFYGCSINPRRSPPSGWILWLGVGFVALWRRR